VTACECDWVWHQGQPCATPAADHGAVHVSPALCMQCLHICEGEREDVEVDKCSGALITRVVGIDSSLSSTGVAAWKLTDDGPLLLGAEAITVPAVPGATITDRAQRVKRISREVDPWTRHVNTLLVIEGLAPSRTHNGGRDSDLAHLWWTIISRHTARADFNCLVAVATPGNVKKWATGNGAADKAAVASVITRLVPQADVTTSDVSDSLALSLLGMHYLGWRPDLVNQYRDEAIKKLAWANGAPA